MALRPLFRDIAAALREKEGSGEPIPARDFPRRIRALPSLPEDLRTIRLLPAPAEGGAVLGGGLASAGMTVTAEARPAAGYRFRGWQEAGGLVSPDPVYTFPVQGDRSLTADFFLPQSLPGRDWKSAVLPAGGWSAITWGGGKFVALSGQNQNSLAAYSADGVRWTASTLPAAGPWSSVAWGGGRFLAVQGNPGVSGTGTDAGAVSTDGVHWTKVTLPYASIWTGLTYGDGKFVAVSPTRRAVWSEDGTVWQKSAIQTGGTWHAVAYGAGKFVVVERSSGFAAYSEDLTTWKRTAMPTEAEWCAVTYGGGKFVALAGGAYGVSSRAAYSADGVHWTEAALPEEARWYGVAWGGDCFAAVASARYGSGKVCAYSAGGDRWERAEMPEEAAWRAVAFGQDRFAAVADKQGTGAYGSSAAAAYSLEA